MPILQWLTREKDVRATQAVPYRLLEEVPALGYGDPSTGNMLIQGDNLETLKSLLPFYAGRVKCIYIDPPYNTKSAFEHYDDSLEHSQWLAMMWPRLELLRDLLSEDGSIWVSIDDNEAHYLKVIMDEIFGRKNFIANFVWQKRYARDNNSAIGNAHDHIILYARNPDRFKASRNRLEPDERTKSAYRNPNDDSLGLWQSISFTGAGYRPNQMYCIIGPNGKEHYPPEGRHWATLEPEYQRLRSEGRFWFGQDGNGVPRIIRYLSEVEGLVPSTWWPHEEVGHNDEGKKEIHGLFGKVNAFDTPKPERLLKRIIEISSSAGDIVLDSFAGSGTSAAVAHKLGRPYIAVEMGQHAETHCKPRLQKVVDGEQGGISEAVGWNGGGGFRYYRLGSPVFDAEGQVCTDIKYPVLAAHIWFSETATHYACSTKEPLLGIHGERAIALLYNGVLSDHSIAGGNVLTTATLGIIRKAISDADPSFTGSITVYGERSALSTATLERENILFKQTPYDIKIRK